MSDEKKITVDEYAEIMAKKVFAEQGKLMEASLRDQFASAAMNAIIIGCNADVCALGIGAAKDAYTVADAMLEARKINEPPK